MQTEPFYNNPLLRELDAAAVRAVKLQRGTFSELIEAYIVVSGRGWSQSTVKSETARLNQLHSLLNKYGFNAEAIYKALHNKGAYTVKTTFIRLSKLFDFAVMAKVVRPVNNPFKAYMTIAAPAKFKTSSVYKPKEIKHSFEDVAGNLNSIEDTSVRDVVDFLLHTGLRISELYKVQVDESGGIFVQGKGGKIRQILGSRRLPKKLPSVSVIRYHLKTTLGITPHTLRKLAATKLARSGELSGSELQQVFGWSSIQTAQLYIQKSSRTELANKIRKAYGK